MSAGRELRRPSAAERARGLATVCSVAVANLIMPTLKDFPTVDYGKIYDHSGRTQQPGGRRDAIPASLEP
jgi:hypothetical protein